MTKFIMRLFLFFVFTFYFATAHSQDDLPQSALKNSANTSHNTIEEANLSGKALLQKAKSFNYNELEKSIQLATLALSKSQKNNNVIISARAHSLLGKLFQKSNKIEQSLTHFLQASLIYKKMGSQSDKIKSLTNYVNILSFAKRYEQAEKLTEQIIPAALKYGDDLLIAKILIAKADTFYQQQHYKLAVEQYTNSVKYLSDLDGTAQKKLGGVYRNIAQSYKRLKNTKKASVYYKKALAIYTSLHNTKLIARTLNTLAEAQRGLGNYVVALDYSTRGLELHKKLNDPLGRAKALVGAGIIYRYIGRYEKSLKHIREAHAYYKTTNNLNGLAKTSNQMGLIYTRLKQFDLAKSFYQLTIDLPKKDIEAQTLASALREMAVINLNAKNYSSAMVMAQEAQQIYQSMNDKSKGSLIARIIGNIYRAEKNSSQAIIYYRESLSLATEVGSEIYQVKAQTPLSRALIDRGEIDEAINLLKSALKLSTKINSKKQKLIAYRWLKLAEKSRGNIAKSLYYAEKEINLSKVIQKEREDSELVLAKAKLYSHKLEMELEWLKEKAKLDKLALAKKNSEIEIAEQASLISELELTKNRYASVTLASLLVICVLISILIYRKFIFSKKQNKELDYLAARDPLTTCYNRRILFDFMNRDFLGLERFDGYCIILADIDHFKAVNDTYGHTTGDNVLRAVANILQTSIRNDGIVARFGGEEFCIVLPNISKSHALDIAQNICEQVRNTILNDVSVTCSFGVSSIEFGAQTPIELIDQADLALFRSKFNGRDQVTLWDKTLKDEDVVETIK